MYILHCTYFTFLKSCAYTLMLLMHGTGASCVAYIALRACIRCENILTHATQAPTNQDAVLVKLPNSKNKSCFLLSVFYQFQSYTIYNYRVYSTLLRGQINLFLGPYSTSMTPHASATRFSSDGLCSVARFSPNWPWAEDASSHQGRVRRQGESACSPGMLKQPLICATRPD